MAATAAQALGTGRFVQLDGGDGIVVAAGGRAAPLLVSSGDFAGVLRAARDVQRDIGKVSGATPAWRTDTATTADDLIIAGTLGRPPPLIDRLAKEGKIDAANLAGQCEGFLIQAVVDPMPGVKRALVIAGSDQRDLIRKEWRREPDTVPQLWSLYKEVQDYYEKGMRVPDDMLLLWCDDNWGNIRRLPTAEERKRRGGAGVYYHFDYVGVPRSYKWLNVAQIGKVWEQMNLANEYGANRMWIVNVGDLKPMEVPTEFFLSYAWDPAAWPAERLPDYLRQWAAREFGERHAHQIADIVDKYTRYNARRRPEQLAPDTYSLVNYDEAERVVADYTALAEEAQRIGKTLPKAMRDAYFQLVEYPVRASANAVDLYVSAGRNQLYARQERVSTNDMAARVRRLFRHDAELARQYQHGISAGKWNHMMSQTRFGYTNWDQPYRDVMPAVSELRIPEPGQLAAPNGIHPSDRMGVAVDGNPVAWPVFPIRQLVLPVLDRYERKPRHIDLFNRSAHRSTTRSPPASRGSRSATRPAVWTRIAVLPSMSTGMQCRPA